MLELFARSVLASQHQKVFLFGDNFFSHNLINSLVCLNLNSFPQSLCTNTECCMNAIAMVYVISLSIKHGLNKKLVLLLHVLVCGLSWLWVDCFAFVKGLAKVNQSSANIAQIHESRMRNPRPQDIHMI